MKRCPVCGVMMGDNVARCSMCKYDFQKASQGNNDEAAAEAKRILEQKQQDNIARAEAKRSEEEKRILEALEKLKRDYAAMEEQFETEKAKLDKEFTTYQKKKLAEQEALEKSVDTIRDEVIEARDKRDALRKEANELYTKLADAFCTKQRKTTSQTFAKAQKQKDAAKKKKLLQDAIAPLDKCLTEYPDNPQKQKVIENKQFLEQELGK